MTRDELVDSIKARFAPLYVKDPQVEALALQALLFVQSHGGYWITVPCSDSSGVFDAPDDALGPVILLDSRRRRHKEARADAGKVQMTLASRSSPPYSMVYLQDLTKLNGDDEVPSAVSQQFGELLEAMIEKPNTQLARAAATLAGIAGDHLKSDADLDARIEEVRAKIRGPAANAARVLNGAVMADNYNQLVMLNEALLETPFQHACNYRVEFGDLPAELAGTAAAKIKPLICIPLGLPTPP